MFSVVKDEELIQLAFPSGEGGSHRLTDEEDRYMWHIIQCVKTKSFITFLLGNEPVRIHDTARMGERADMESATTGYN